MGTPQPNPSARPHPAALAEQDLLADCDVTRTRRGGPGGQHRNKVETAIVLMHRPTGLRAEASERRSQQQNLSVALRRLRLKLAVEVRTPAIAPPSALWLSRCRGGRISINGDHADYPALLAEALDAIADHDHDVSAAAASLGCTATQLVNLLRIEPAALESVNRRRAELGLAKLR